MRYRRGLSNVVTAAIFLTAVTVLGSGLVVWSNGNLKAFETSLVTNSANATNQISENLNIENVAFCKFCKNATLGHNNGIINITLTNTGTLPLTIKKITINSTDIQSYVNKQNNIVNAFSINIFPQKSNTTSAVLPGQIVWGSNRPDTITITTARGSIFTTQAGAP